MKEAGFFSKKHLYKPLISVICFSMVFVLQFNDYSIWAVLTFFVIGFLFFFLWFVGLKKEGKEMIQFVKDTSVVIHNRSLTVQGFLDVLEEEGFEIHEYPYQNYYACRVMNKKTSYDFFLANDDTPDCEEAEAYSSLFISRIMAANVGAGYFFDLEYGENMEHTMRTFMPAIQQGFMLTKNNFIFGYRAAYDTKTKTLYFADAVKNIEWCKTSFLSKYTNELLAKLFGE